MQQKDGYCLRYHIIFRIDKGMYWVNSVEVVPSPKIPHTHVIPSCCIGELNRVIYGIIAISGI
jgi:hypothetical protein